MSSAGRCLGDRDVPRQDAVSTTEFSVTVHKSRANGYVGYDRLIEGIPSGLCRAAPGEIPIWRLNARLKAASES
jgi:hypothetical protein